MRIKLGIHEFNVLEVAQCDGQKVTMTDGTTFELEKIEHATILVYATALAKTHVAMVQCFIMPQSAGPAALEIINRNGKVFGLAVPKKLRTSGIVTP